MLSGYKLSTEKWKWILKVVKVLLIVCIWVLLDTMCFGSHTKTMNKVRYEKWGILQRCEFIKGKNGYHL